MLRATLLSTATALTLQLEAAALVQVATLPRWCAKERRTFGDSH